VIRRTTSVSRKKFHLPHGERQIIGDTKVTVHFTPTCGMFQAVLFFSSVVVHVTVFLK